MRWERRGEDIAPCCQGGEDTVRRHRLTTPFDDPIRRLRLTTPFDDQMLEAPTLDQTLLDEGESRGLLLADGLEGVGVCIARAC